MRRLAAVSASMTPSAASDPRSPSKLPPFGTESMCEPKSIGGKRRVGTRATSEDIPAWSTRGSRPAARIKSDHVPATGDIGVRVRDAADTVGERPAGRSAEHAECFNALPQDRGIDTSRHVLRGCVPARTTGPIAAAARFVKNARLDE